MSFNHRKTTRIIINGKEIEDVNKSLDDYINKAFSSIDKGFESIDKSFDKAFDSLDKSFERFDEAFENIAKNNKKYNGKMKRPKPWPEPPGEEGYIDDFRISKGVARWSETKPNNFVIFIKNIWNKIRTFLIDCFYYIFGEDE